MGGPGLNQDHITSDQTCRICAIPRVRLAPEHNGSIVIFWVAKDFVKMDCESIEMTDMEGPEVGVEGIVEQAVIDGKVHRRLAPGPSCSRSRSGLGF